MTSTTVPAGELRVRVPVLYDEYSYSTVRESREADLTMTFCFLYRAILHRGSRKRTRKQ